MASPTIYVNGRFLTQRSTGIQNFALGICHELYKMNCSVVFLTPTNVISTPSFGSVIKLGSLKGHLWEQLDLPRYVKQNKIDTLVNLGNSAPILLSNNFVTIHDLAFLQPEKWFSNSYRLFYSFLTPRILKKAKAIFTVSETSKKEISKQYKIQADTISTLKNGIYIPETSLSPKIETPEKYFLFVGSLDPRKRVQFLIDSFNELNDKKIKLLIVGAANPIFTQKQLGINSEITFLENVNDAQLQVLYKNAMALVLPSLYEGFGRPILEALYHKTEVICSDIPVFRENFDTYVHFFNTKEKGSLTSNLNKLSKNGHTKLASKCPSTLFSYRFAAHLILRKH